MLWALIEPLWRPWREQWLRKLHMWNVNVTCLVLRNVHVKWRGMVRPWPCVTWSQCEMTWSWVSVARFEASYWKSHWKTSSSENLSKDFRPSKFHRERDKSWIIITFQLRSNIRNHEPLHDHPWWSWGISDISVIASLAHRYFSTLFRRSGTAGVPPCAKDQTWDGQYQVGLKPFCIVFTLTLIVRMKHGRTRELLC